MRLLIISESPLEKIGADYYAVDTWIRFPLHLSAHCEGVTIWSPVVMRDPKTHPSPDSWRVEQGYLKIEHHGYYNSFLSYYRLWPRFIKTWKKQANKLIQENDVIILRLPSPMNTLIAKVAREMEKPLVVMVAGNIETQSDRLIHSRGAKRLFYLGLVKLLVLKEINCSKNAALVYAYSDELALRHKGTRGSLKRIRTPHLRADDIVYRNDTCQDDEIKILRLSWLIPSKGLEYLLESIALLVAKGISARLEIVGKERFSGYQEKLEQLAKQLGIREKVVFTGWVPFDQIGDVYIRNDIQVISSLSEGTPRCIIEGFARGVPLVCTAVGGCISTLTNEDNALLVPPGDPNSMAAAVERLIKDGELRRRLIEQGYKTATNATFETLGMNFLDELRQLSNRSC